MVAGMGFADRRCSLVLRGLLRHVITLAPPYGGLVVGEGSRCSSRGRISCVACFLPFSAA